jgi:hypothetical protein
MNGDGLFAASPSGDFRPAAIRGAGRKGAAPATSGWPAAVLAVAAAASVACGGDASVRNAQPPDSALQRMADEAIPRVEASAGLEFRHRPRLARSDRERVEAFLASELERQLPPERAEATSAAYVRLGLLPDTLDLRELMRSLYLEQVVGYYSPQADTLFVREGVEGRALEPVLVHELVHALQDQHMDLDSLMRARRGSNDALTAALAALEGHATYVMLEDELRRRTGGDVDLQGLDVGALLGGVDLAEMAAAPALSAAPRVVRESLVFPYTGGLTFVQEVWRAREGRPAPLGRDTPASTEQVLHPGRFAGEERDAPTGVAFRNGPPAGWTEVHADGLGEFEARLFLEEFLPDTARARRAAAGWDGDRYRLLRDDDGREALIWATVWDSAEEAEEFAAAAGPAFRRRYGRPPGGGSGDASGASAGAGPAAEKGGAAGFGAQERLLEVRRETVSGRPVVVVVDLSPGTRGELLPGAVRVSLEGSGGA